MLLLIPLVTSSGSDGIRSTVRTERRYVYVAQAKSLAETSPVLLGDNETVCYYRYVNVIPETL